VKRAVAISLKIPDNTAYTALVALRRLGVDAHRVERSEIWLFDDDGDVEILKARVAADETIFNPNKHRLAILDEASPRAGEVWIQALEAAASAPEAIAWRLLNAHGEPVERAVLEAAIDRLLRNPAIEKATHA
jgi:hypothetical protein